MSLYQIKQFFLYVADWPPWKFSIEADDTGPAAQTNMVIAFLMHRQTTHSVNPFGYLKNSRRKKDCQKVPNMYVRSRVTQTPS